MSEIYVTETDPEQLKADAANVTAAVNHRRRKETLQAMGTALFAVLIIVALLALVSMLSTNPEAPQIISYQSNLPEEDPPIKTKKLTNNAQPKPPGASSSMAKVLSAQVASAVSIPVPEVTNPDSMFGMEEAFGPGFGSGNGSGDGGGGSSFFGSRRSGRNVVFCVDFSGSMESNLEEGSGTRIQALKKELIKSINALSSNMQVSVIYFSTTGWTIDTDGPNFHENGFSGIGQVPDVLWYPATEQYKKVVTDSVSNTPSKGGTNWYPPLKMAFSMTPRPDIIYLLSDGQANDADTVIEEMSDMNPNGIPIDAIAFELAGTPAFELMSVAKETSGKFSMIYKGKRHIGRDAEKFTGSEYD